jgi:hypothetical protein
MSESYRFTGPQGPTRKFGPNKGVMRELRESKRLEAKIRQAKHDRELKKVPVTAGS